MKKLVTVTEVENEGLISLMGKVVVFLCESYFYTGKLIGVNDNFVLLEEASIIYETGPWNAKKWQNSEKLPYNPYIMIAKIESYGLDPYNN